MEHIDNSCWHKSSYSGNGGNCVEVASNLTGIVTVRDSKNVSGPVLVVSDQAWLEFTEGIKAGEFGL